MDFIYKISNFLIGLKILQNILKKVVCYVAIWSDQSNHYKWFYRLVKSWAFMPLSHVMMRIELSQMFYSVAFLMWLSYFAVGCCPSNTCIWFFFSRLLYCHKSGRWCSCFFLHFAMVIFYLTNNWMLHVVKVIHFILTWWVVFSVAIMTHLLRSQLSPFVSSIRIRY